MKGFFGYLHRAGMIPTDPSRLIRRAITSPPPPRALTAKEEKRFLAALAEAKGPEETRDAALFTLLLGSGLRLSSALDLILEDIDFDECVLTVRTKGDRSERVYIAENVRDELQKFIGNRTGAIFADRFGRRISARHAQRRFRQWREKAGISRSITCHGLRHSYAMRLYARSGDIALVQRALGHRSIASTLVYARADENRLRTALVS